WIQADTIVKVFDQLPESFGGEQIDLAEKYVIPGLYDMHTHSWGNLAPGGLADILSTDGTAKRMLYAGVVGFLDLFSPEAYILSLRDQQRQNPQEVPGANIHAAGPIFTCTDGHGTEYGTPTRIINSPEDAFREMEELAPLKPDVIKIMYNRNPPYMPSMDKATMKAIIQAAHEHNFKVVSHINTWEDIADVVEAGIDGFTHTPKGLGPDSLIQEIKEKGIVYIPTLSVHMGLLSLIQSPSHTEEPMLRAITLEGVVNAYQDTTKFTPRDKGWLRYQRRNRDSVQAAFSQLAASGVTILPGTDSGNLGTFQGYSLQMELALMKELGMTEWDILTSATYLAPRWIGTKTGFSSGAKASFLLLEHSPVESLDHLKDISNILHHGEWVERTQLLTQVSFLD
ncbi:MAG: amidohydrolase family protein, partial [Bacteroidota bacterium]